jgi:hypothetical protein
MSGQCRTINSLVTCMNKLCASSAVADSNAETGSSICSDKLSLLLESPRSAVYHSFGGTHAGESIVVHMACGNATVLKSYNPCKRSTEPATAAVTVEVSAGDGHTTAKDERKAAVQPRDTRGVELVLVTPLACTRQQADLMLKTT